MVSSSWFSWFALIVIDVIVTITVVVVAAAYFRLCYFTDAEHHIHVYSRQFNSRHLIHTYPKKKNSNSIKHITRSIQANYTLESIHMHFSKNWLYAVDKNMKCEVSNVNKYSPHITYTHIHVNCGISKQKRTVQQTNKKKHEALFTALNWKSIIKRREKRNLWFM